MASKGKYFQIKSKSCGLYLDVKGGATAPGTPVILWNKHDADNQQWYYDPHTRTIRSKASNLCLDINGSNRLVINPYRHGAESQQWSYNKKKDTIEGHGNRVLDVADNKKTAGAEVCAWDNHGGDNQKWSIDHKPSKYFYIRSALDGGKVMDVSGASKSPGAKIILYSKKSSGADNQLWYEDCYGNIRSKLSDKLTLDGTRDSLHTGEYADGKYGTYWALNGNKIASVHDPNKVLDVKGGSAADGTEICIWTPHGNANQQWHFDYV